MTYPVDWWHERKKDLISLVRTHSPVYVYNEEVVNDTLFDLLSIDAIDSLFYPLHINHHPQILEQANRLGAGFRCVSSTEISYLLECFPSMKPGKLLLIPNTTCPHDYNYGLKLGVNVVVNSLHPLRAWPDIFRKREIFIGIDMDNQKKSSESSTSHQYPSGTRISYSQIEPLMEILDRMGISLKGVHIQCHGSMHDSPELTKALSSLFENTSHFSDVAFLTLSNGLCKAIKDGQGKLDISLLTGDLEHFSDSYPWAKLWFDPGSDVVSHAGALLTSVHQVYKSEGIDIVKIDVDMKSLIQRGLLHGRDHHVLNLSKVNEEATKLTHIIGQDGEPWNGLGYMKKLSPAKKGDILLFTNAGAYGSDADLSTHFGEPVSEYYLRARRICQVPI